ncbi:MAG: LLM class flavin-dependent oxidoreductase, partial [Pseudomonas sp.]
MSIEFVGMIFPRQWSETRGVRSPDFDLDFIRHHARAHEHAGFDRVLIASGPGSADSLQIAAYAAAHTERLGFMIAHRPGLTAPTVAARAFATLDHTTGGGRIRLHAITGITAEPQEGDFLLDKTERYQRTDEYLEIVRRTWTAEEPFDFEGKYFNIKGAFSPVKPLQQPHIPISFGGSSDIAYQIAVKHADLYALWGEPLSGVAEQIAKLKAAASAAGVQAPRVSLS